MIGKVKSVIKNNSGALQFMALNYLDKALIFLTPMFILFLFNSDELYVELESIYSLAIVLIPILDLGMSGFAFYEYKHKEKDVNKLLSRFGRYYVLLFFISILHVGINYFFLSSTIYVLVNIRCLYTIGITFLSSFFRLNDKPKFAVYFSLIVSVFNCLAILAVFLLGQQIFLEILFIGQGTFIVLFSLILIKKYLKISNLKESISFGKRSIVFAWATMFQVFLNMYVANYAKIHGVKEMTVDDASLFSQVQRFAMLIHLTHVGVLAYMSKELYLEGDRDVSKDKLKKYLVILIVSSMAVFCMIMLNYFRIDTSLNRYMMIVGCIVIYTLFWCIYSYLELFFGRENKNYLKLIISIVGAIVFFVTIYIPTGWDLTMKFGFGMVFSAICMLLLSIYILYKRNYKLV